MFTWRFCLCRFVSFQRMKKAPTLWGCLLWYFDYKQGSFGSRDGSFTAFRNLNRSLNKTRMSPTQTMTTEWTAEKCLGKRVQSKQTPKHELGIRINKQMVKSAGRRSLPKAVKKSLSSNSIDAKGNIDWKSWDLWISRQFRFIQFDFTVRKITNSWICKTASKFEKYFKKWLSYGSHSL